MTGERTLRDLAAALAVELGLGWELEINREGCTWLERISREDGAQVYLNSERRPPGRVTIGGSSGCPDFRIGSGFGCTPSPTITVAATRSTESIIADIRRRFLPQFLAAVREAKRLQSLHDRRVRNANQLAESLAEILGDEVRRWKGKPEVYAHGCDVKIELNSVDFHVRRADPELALRIARVVVEYAQETAPLRASA